MRTRKPSPDAIDPRLLEVAIKAVQAAQPPSDQEATTVSVYSHRGGPNMPNWATTIMLGLLAFFAVQTYGFFQTRDGDVSAKIDRILSELTSIQTTLASQEQGAKDIDRRVTDLEQRVSVVEHPQSSADRGAKH